MLKKVDFLALSNTLRLFFFVFFFVFFFPFSFPFPFPFPFLFLSFPFFLT